MKRIQAELAGNNSGYVTAFEYIPFARNQLSSGKKDEEALANLLEGAEVKAAAIALEDAMAWEKEYQTAAEFDTDGQDFAFVDDNNTDYGNDFDVDNRISVQDDSIHGNGDENEMPVSHTILADFRCYVAKTSNNPLPLSDIEIKAINLLALLRKTKASLETYDMVMEWHLKSSGLLKEWQSLGNSFSYLTRQKVFTSLRSRYNMPKEKWGLTKNILLPSSNTKATIVYNDAQAVVQKLLTDPRIWDEDYLFFDNDPFSPPPDNLDYIGDLNTGLSYIETHRQLITKPGKQVLLPVLFYFDGANTGQFENLPITAVRIALGIFNRKARDRDEFWGTLGYIPTTRADQSRGMELLRKSGHVDFGMAHQDYIEGEGNFDNNKVEKAQDYHAMLACILSGYVELQRTGFTWDLFYRGNLYKDIEFVLFTPFLKLDTKEADKACGSYEARTRGVAQLCRKCCCPTEDSDNHLANYARKTKAVIEALVEEGDVQGLKAISQQLIKNAMYAIRFGLHSDQSVHGSCPFEMLHFLLLGLFLYIRDMFFEQLGSQSKIAEEIKALAKEYGQLFPRQSDRDFP